MHRFILSAVTLSILLLSSSLALAARNAPIDLMLGPPEGMKASKTMVAFSHDKHSAAKIDCVSCHHTWDGKSDVKKCGTSGCHEQPGKKGTNTFYTAFHTKKSQISCVGCHKVAKKEGKNVPVSCKSCHPK